MQNPTTARLGAALRSVCLKSVLLVAAMTGTNQAALACNTGSQTPAATLSLSTTTSVAPGSVTLTAGGHGGYIGCTTFAFQNIAIYVNGAVATTSTSTSFSYTLSNLSPGTYSIYAQVNTTGESVASGTQTLTVNPVQPTISLSSPAGGASYNAPASIPMSVNVTGGTYAISSVSYYNGSTLLGSATSSPWSYTATGLYGGSYALNAKVTTSGSTTATSATNTVSVVTVPSSITLSTPANGATYPAPSTLTLTANPTAGTYPIKSVSFYNGSTLLGTVTSAPWTYNAANLAAGTYAFSAQVTNSQGTVVSSATNTVKVLTPPTISMAGPADGSGYLPASSITFSANTSAGGYTISGVSYYTSAGTLIGTASSAPWSYPANSGLPAGSYAIYAVLNTTTSGVSVTSTPITITVGTATGAPITSATPIPVAITAPSTSNPAAGTLPGALTATVNGSSAYAIPLAVPPGVGGLTPSLELDYDSQHGNGFLGLGWTLGGMSSIHRCGKTIAQDNVTGGVSFANTDRLCLDGQRLILLSAGTGATGNPDVDYWTVGATYSTEIANFSRITSYTGSKGLAFKVETKAGRILYYGDQGDSTSYIAAQGRSDSQAIVWALGQVQDLSGNYYTISYSNSNTTGEYLPTQITYGGNNQTSLAAHLSIVFNYVTTRTDNTVRYIAGSHNDMVSLISNIKVYNGLYSSGSATEVREFDISYTNSASSGRTLVSSIQMQALNPQTKALVAFPATTFSWNQNGTPSFSQVGSAAVSGPVAPYTSGTTPTIEYTNIIWADFNGDGKLDAMVVDTSKNPVQYNIYLAQTGGGFAAPIVWTVPSTIATTIAARKATETAAGYPFQSNQTIYPGQSNWGLVGDFNGDGSSDLYLFGGFVCLSQLKTNPTTANAFSCTDSGTNTATTSGTGASLVSWNSQDYLVMNTTGTGLSDIVMRNGQYSDGTRCVSVMNNGTQSFNCGVYTNSNYVITGTLNKNSGYVAPTNTDNVWVSNQIGMFSGSGRQDIYRANVPSSGTGAYYMEVCTSGATGFTCTNWGAYPTAVSNGTTGGTNTDANPQLQGTTLLADANSDGLTDVMLPGSINTSGTGADAEICYSTGTKFDCHALTAAAGADSVMQHIGAIDNDGGIKTLAFEYNAAGTAGSWRECFIKGNSTLSCQTISGGPTMPAASIAMPDPIVQFGGFLNDGTFNLLAYNESIDTTGAKANNFTSTGTAWTPYTLAPNANLAADALASVTNGVGRISSVTYTQGGQASVYTQYASNANGTIYPTYPQVSMPNPGYLVSSLNDSNGQGGSVQSTYAYNALLIDAAGRGSLGFSWIDTNNPLSNVNKQIYYRQDWPYVGMVANTITAHTTSPVTTTSTTTNDFTYLALPSAYYSANSGMGGSETTLCTICFPYYLDSTTVNTDLSGADLGTTVTNNVTYDNFGNLLTSTVTSKLAADTNAFVTSTTNTWDNDTGTCVASHGAAYVIGRLCGTTVSKTNEAGSTLTRANASTYFATGLVQTSTLEPNQTTLPNNNQQVTNTYTRDGYGNILSTVQSWLDPASSSTLSRTVSITYTSDGRFPASSTNALGQTESYASDPVTGVKTQLTDINGLVTTWTVDGLGRVLSQTTPDGNVTQTAVNQCKSDCPTGATTVTVTTRTNGGSQTTVPILSYANPLGQVIRTMSYGFSGTPIVTDHTFDSRSRALANYQPAFASGATAAYPSGVLANTQTLDDINRPLTAVTLDTSGAQLTTATSYAGNVKTIVNPAGETRIETRDVLGELIAVQTSATNNAPQTNTAFAYDPFGNLIQTTDPAGNNINVTYDVMGHKIQLNDPDLGIINYSVDPVGRTWKQVSPNENANGTATTFQFDLLDRMIARVEPDLNSSFIYDVSGATGATLTASQITSCQSAKSCGKLVESYTAPLSNPSSNVGVISSTNSAKESDTVYNYDSLGRPANNTLTLDASLNMTFYSETDYDAWGRPITQISQHGSDPQKAFDQRYNAYGYLQSIQRSGFTLWQATSQDAMNRVVTARIATAGGPSDGLIVTRCFDANTARMDSAVVASVANSVNCGTTPATATVLESYVYDDLGNVLQRNEAWNQGIAGTVASQSFTEGFTYDGLNRILISAVTNQPQQNFSYTVDGNILSNTAAGNYTYTGGTSGGPHAVKSVSGAATAFTYDADGNQLTGNSRTNTWTSFDMPASLSYTGAGSQFPSSVSQFTYGPNHERRKQIQGSAAIIYYGGAQEVQTDGSNNITEIKTYWPMGLGVEIDTPSQTASVLNWTHTDHLGSVIAITDINGNLKEALGYDAWGNRRNAQGAPVSIATYQTAAINETTDDKGYTGAEQIASLGLVHLNGRVYDPLIGKFLSGDPLVQDPKNGQNYNRYAYVMNNPMNSTDPSGFSHIVNLCIPCVMGMIGGGGGGDGSLAGMSMGFGFSAWTMADDDFYQPDNYQPNAGTVPTPKPDNSNPTPPASASSGTTLGVASTDQIPANTTVATNSGVQSFPVATAQQPTVTPLSGATSMVTSNPWSPPSLPQGLVNFSAGFGDGILATMSLGFVSGQSIRSNLGSDGSVNALSAQYSGGQVTGTALTMAAFAGYSIPSALTHFTTEAGAAGIASSGIINASTGLTLFGDGIYATAGSTIFVPSAATIPIVVDGAGFIRIVPNAVYLSGGSAQTAAWFATWGVVSNFNATKY